MHVHPQHAFSALSRRWSRGSHRKELGRDDGAVKHGLCVQYSGVEPESLPFPFYSPSPHHPTTFGSCAMLILLLRFFCVAAVAAAASSPAASDSGSCPGNCLIAALIWAMALAAVAEGAAGFAPAAAPVDPAALAAAAAAMEGTTRRACSCCAIVVALFWLALRSCFAMSFSYSISATRRCIRRGKRARRTHTGEGRG